MNFSFLLLLVHSDMQRSKASSKVVLLVCGKGLRCCNSAMQYWSYVEMSPTGSCCGTVWSPHFVWLHSELRRRRGSSRVRRAQARGPQKVFCGFRRGWQAPKIDVLRVYDMGLDSDMLQTKLKTTFMETEQFKLTQFQRRVWRRSDNSRHTGDSTVFVLLVQFPLEANWNH